MLVWRVLLILVNHLVCDNFPGRFRERSSEHSPSLIAFHISSRYFWSEIRSRMSTTVEWGLSTASKFTNWSFSQETKFFPIGPEKSLRPEVPPSSFVNKAFNRSLLSWSWQALHCSGLPNSNSRNRIIPACSPVFVGQTSQSTQSRLEVLISLS